MPKTKNKTGRAIVWSDGTICRLPFKRRKKARMVQLEIAFPDPLPPAVQLEIPELIENRGRPYGFI